MTDKKFIIVARQESVATSWAREASDFVMSSALIGLGVFVESPAMQWLGAILAFIAIIIKAGNFAGRHTYDIESAQKALDDIKAEIEGETK